MLERCLVDPAIGSHSARDAMPLPGLHMAHSDVLPPVLPLLKACVLDVEQPQVLLDCPPEGLEILNRHRLHQRPHCVVRLVIVKHVSDFGCHGIRADLIVDRLELQLHLAELGMRHGFVQLSDLIVDEVLERIKISPQFAQHIADEAYFVVQVGNHILALKVTRHKRPAAVRHLVGWTNRLIYFDQARVTEILL